jgi:hypothetical protein
VARQGEVPLSCDKNVAHQDRIARYESAPQLDVVRLADALVA